MEREWDALGFAGMHGLRRKEVHQEITKSTLIRARFYRRHEDNNLAQNEYIRAMQNIEASRALGDIDGEATRLMDSIRDEAAQIGTQMPATVWHATNGTIQEQVPDWVMQYWHGLGHQPADFPALNQVPQYTLPSELRDDSVWSRIVQGR